MLLNLQNTSKSTFILIIHLTFINQCFSQLSKTEHISVVANFVDCIKNRDIEKFETLITYPIKRPYPIPPIKNKEDLKNRFSEIFDEYLIALIVNSNIKKDWSDVGWRGIMLYDGIVWLEYDGSFITTNYASKKEKSMKKLWNACYRDSVPIVQKQ